jgi:flavin-dependent dehydrogenase
MSDYDAIVIGAGPAGSSVSTLLAARGLRVLLLEKSHFPREKLCGEFISPECLAVLTRLGVRARLLAARPQRIAKMVLFAPSGRGIEVPLHWLTGERAPALGLSRRRMDAILLDRAREAGAEVREGFHVSPRLEREGNRSWIEGKTDDQAIERFAARLVIDASGSRRLFAAPAERKQKASFLLPRSRLFACKVHLRGVEGLGEVGELFFYRDGYGGMNDVEDGRTNLCFITTAETLRAAKGDRQALLDLTLLTNPAARRRLRRAAVDGEWLGTGPIIYGRQASAPGVLAIGDAGAFIDPFTGSGMLLAMTSAALAAAVIGQAFAAGEDDPLLIARHYQQFYRAEYGWRFRACALLRRLAFKPLARRLLVPLLARHRALMKLVAQSTRHKGWRSSGEEIGERELWAK